MIKNPISDFFSSYFKLLLFLPYFFSVNKLLFTLFYPWKKTAVFSNGRYKSESFISDLIFNLISILLGFLIRLTVLIIYGLVQFIVLLFLPVFFVLYLILFACYNIQELINPYAKRILKLKKEFLKLRVLETKHLQAGDDWFDIYLKHKHNYHHHTWLNWFFKLKPIAVDWDHGYVPTIEKYAEELTKRTFVANLTEIIDRENELNSLTLSLLNDQGSNTIILGENGVGKHSLIYAMVKKIYNNECKNRLDDYRVFKLNLTNLLNSSNLLENTKTIEKIIKEAEYAGNIILVIDDLFDYFDNKLFNISSIINSLLESKSLHIITTLESYRYLEIKQRYSLIDKVFTTINLQPVTKDQAKTIMLNKCFYYEDKYNIIFTYEAVCSIVDSADYYITDIPFPEKLFKFTEELISFALKNTVKIIKPETIENFIKTQDNTALIFQNIKRKLIHIESTLNKKILYQTQAVKDLSFALKKAALNLGKNKKPFGSFLLLGPTGVGKTHTAKTIAEVFFGSPDKIVRLDMTTVNHPSYILGNKEANIQSDLEIKLRTNKYNVLLLDEFEKTNKEIQELFMTVLDEGYLTTDFGEKIHFRFSFIIATSNALADQIDETTDKNSFIQRLIDNKIFSPELLNRFDGIILYKPLPKEIIIQIAKNKVAKIIRAYEEKQKIKIKFDINQIDWDNLFSNTNYKKFGAREVERVIAEKVEKRIIDAILAKANEGSAFAQKQKT